MLAPSNDEPSDIGSPSALAVKSPVFWLRAELGPFVRRFIGGVILTGIIMLFQNWVTGQDGWMSRSLRRFEYAALQASLFDAYQPIGLGQAIQLPVVIDISDAIPRDPGRETSREKLDALLITLSQYSPSAIGVDIDFSSESGQPVTPDDFRYFAKWKNLKRADGNPLQVFLGVANRAAEIRISWLGNDFAELAAGIVHPKDSQLNYFYVQTPDAPSQ